MAEVPGIYKKIAAIQEGVGAIPMNGVGPAQKGGFAFIKGADLIDGVRREVIKNGVITRVKTLKHEVNAREVNNRTIINTSVLVSYTYIDIDDGSEFENIVAGEGSDIGSDTATRKSFSQALKINHLQVFNISSNEDVDSDSHAPIELPEPGKVEQKAPTKAAEAKAAKEQSVAEIRAVIAEKFIQDPKSPYDSASVNALGKKITGKESNGSDGWGFNVGDLKKIIAALDRGETA